MKRSRIYRMARELLASLSELSFLVFSPGMSRYKMRRLTVAEEIDTALALATGSFVEHGKISEEEVDPATGLLRKDEMLDRRIVFGCYRNDQLLATGCLVHAPHMAVTESRMPVEQLSAESAAMFLSVPDGQLAEVASVAKVPGTPSIALLGLLYEMVRYCQHSLGVQYLSCGLEPRALRKYKANLGGVIHELAPGQTVYFPGIQTPQCALLFKVGEHFDITRENILKAETNGLHDSISRRFCHFYMTQLSRRSDTTYTPAAVLPVR